MSDYSFFKNCPYTSPFHSHKYIIRSKFFTILSFAHLENGHSLFFVCLFAFSLIGHSLFIGVLIPRLLLIQFALGCQIPKTQFDHSSLCSRIINGSFLFAVFCSNFFLIAGHFVLMDVQYVQQLEVGPQWLKLEVVMSLVSFFWGLRGGSLWNVYRFPRVLRCILTHSVPIVLLPFISSLYFLDLCLILNNLRDYLIFSQLIKFLVFSKF